MTYQEMIELLRDNIASDATMKAWSQSAYSVDQTVFIGIDERNPPKESEYPAIHVYPINRSGSLCPGQDRMSIGVVLGIYDTREYVENAGTKTLPGIMEIEAGVRILHDIIMTSDMEDTFVSTLDIIYETVEFFPYFLVETIIEYDATPEYGACG